MDFSAINDIQMNGKKLMIIFPKNPKSNTQYLWRRLPEYPYLTFALCRKMTLIGDEIHVSGTHIYEYMYFCPGFTDGNKLLTPIDPYYYTHETLRWPYRSNGYSEIFNSKTAITPAAEPTLNGGIIVGEYYHNLGSKISNEYTFRAYGVKNEADHLNFYNRLRELGANLLEVGNATPLDLQEWEVLDAEWSVSTEEAGKIQVWNSTESINSPISYYLQNFPNYITFNQGSLGYWPTSYYEKTLNPNAKTIAMGTPIITLDGKKGATKVVSVRDDFSDYKIHFSSSTSYINTCMKIDCKSKSLGINETWGKYIGVTVKL